ncbi:TetR/AcrR family transcriptional regulator [Microbacterium timonense]|uniref:TetR/AcrR family transcriptional regulator n=1 Tax=Microbacterium timonense TaxID=2086576 RepID=UPI000D0F3894|nr:TetR family transcriptional regulator [Microbacterium timonense]
MATTARGDATRTRILDAALAEFSTHGLAGARVDRIAVASKSNKNLIYVNFESKEQLFRRVLEHGLQDAYRTLPRSAIDLPVFAGRVFDFAHSHPALYRLIEWAILEGQAALPAERGDFYTATLASVAEGQRLGTVTTAHSPAFLITMTMAMSTAWVPAFPFGAPTSPTGVPSDAREQLLSAVAAIASPTRSDDPRPVPQRGVAVTPSQQPDHWRR